MKDKDIKLEEIEVFHTLGGAGEAREGHILIMIYPKCSRRLSVLVYLMVIPDLYTDHIVQSTVRMRRSCGGHSV
jgi:hypothetical protein